MARTRRTRLEAHSLAAAVVEKRQRGRRLLERIPEPSLPAGGNRRAAELVKVLDETMAVRWSKPKLQLHIGRVDQIPIAVSLASCDRVVLLSAQTGDRGEL